MVAKLKEKYDVEVDWRPFYLNPNTPPDGLPLPDYVQRARANGSDDRLRQMATLYGMEFTPVDRVLYTRRAHEATEYARLHGQLEEFHRTVFRKVYGEGQDISRWDVLRAAAVETGMDPDAMQQAVDGGAYTAEVAHQVQYAQQIGVSGVPTYVIDGRYALVGAQPLEVFQRALAQIFEQTD